MLKSLEVKNYRNLQEIKIKSLSNVNLITGKNNTGKSTILEAIALYASKGDLSILYQLLTERGENFRQSESNKNPTESNIRSLSSLFTNRVVGFENENIITIGEIEETLFGSDISNDQSISFRFVRYYDEIQRDNQGAITTQKRTILDNSNEKQIPIFKFGFETRTANNSFIPCSGA